MALTPLTGLVDSNVFVDGYVPHGSEVSVELTTIISKQTEVLTQVNANEVDIATNRSNIGSGFVVTALDSATSADVLVIASHTTTLYTVVGTSGTVEIDLNDPDLFVMGRTLSIYAPTAFGGTLNVVLRKSGGTIVDTESDWGNTNRLRKYTVLPQLIAQTDKEWVESSPSSI